MRKAGSFIIANSCNRWIFLINFAGNSLRQFSSEFSHIGGFDCVARTGARPRVVFAGGMRIAECVFDIVFVFESQTGELVNAFQRLPRRGCLATPAEMPANRRQ